MSVRADAKANANANGTAAAVMEMTHTVLSTSSWIFFTASLMLNWMLLRMFLKYVFSST